MKNITLTTFIVLVAFTLGFGQTTEKTKNTLDQSLRSTARVNPSTLAMEISIPIANYPGRNGHSLPLVFNYSSKLWRLELNAYGYQGGSGDYTTNIPKYAEKSAAGWTSSFGVAVIEPDLSLYDCSGKFVGEEANPQVPLPSGCGGYVYMKRVRVKLPDGSNIELRLNDNLYSGSFGISDYYGTYLSTDGTRARLEFGSTSILYMSDGSRYFFGSDMRGTKYQDESGNEIYFTGSTKTWSDTLGRTLVSPLPLNLGIDEQTQSVGTDEFEIPGLSGGDPLQYSIVWKELDDSGVLLESESLAYTGNQVCPSGSLTSNFLFLGGSNTRICQSATTFNPVVMYELILPNGAKYKFQYNKYGEITKIHYPTGGYERFEYAQIATLSYRADVIYERTNRGVTDRWVRESSSADELHWTYEAIKSTNLLRIKTTAPDGVTITDNATETNWANDFPSNKIKYGFDNPAAGRLYDEKVYSDTTLYSRKLTEYEYSGYLSGGWGDATRDARVKRTISIIFDPGNSNALASMTEITYDTGTSYDASYFPSLNAVTTKTYDYVVVAASTAAGTITPSGAAGWFSGATAAVVNKNVYLYDSNYKTRNISGLVTETRVEDASGNVKAKTQISYDEGAYLTSSSGTMPSAASGRWTDLTGSGSTEFGATIGTKRGLVTSVRSYYDIANSYYIDTHTFFDQFGNPVKSRDGVGNDTTTTFDEDYAFAYPTSVTTPVPDSSNTYGSNAAFTSTTTFDYNTGLPMTVTDPNGAVTAMEYDDPLLRPTTVTVASGTALAAETRTEYGTPSSGVYSDAQRYVKIKSQIDSTNWKEGYTWADGLGRTIRSQSVDAESGDVFTITCYDNMGRVSKGSNPFRNYNATNQNCSTTNGSYEIHWTTNTFDTAGRPWKVTTPDGAIVETTYGLASTSSYLLGTVVTVEDQADKQRRSITNALGQVKRVDEPTTSGTALGDPTAPNQDTTYAYDYLNNLTTVTQGAQTRTFTYDALSRLKTAVNPESGTINYTYDANGNLATKVDARSITTSYAYDRLNRVTQRSYAMPSPTPSPSQYQNSPTVNYYYDNITNGKGKLKKVTSSVSTTEYTLFDILGRVTASKQTTDGGDSAGYAMTYTYNLGGAMIEQQYPSGRVVKNTLNATGDLSMVASRENSSAIYKTYVNDFTYNAAGAVTSLKLGNGKFESTTFNSRLQPTRIALGASVGDTSSLKLDYEYGATAAVNNGNVTKQTITVPGMTYPLIQSYTYDSLNRLDDASETSNGTTTWRQDFSYDRYGNRNFVEANTSFAGFDKLCNSNTELCATLRKQLNPGINSGNNNRMNSGQDYTYDAAGNTLTDANGQIFVYDGENKQVKASTSSGTVGEYFYDGDGKRVKKVVPGTGETTIFVYDAAGKQIAEYSTIVADASAAKVAYLTADHLGSPRINTDVTGAVTSRHDYHPFGEEVATSQRTSGLGYAADTVRKQFTGYERDGETDLDFAQARFFVSSVGRFSSPDETLIDQRTGNPQSWNLYIYVRNSPVSCLDPTGKTMTDFVDKDTGVVTNVNDKIDQVLAATTAEIQNAVDMFAKQPGIYNALVSAMSSTSVYNTNLKKAEFDKLANAVYAESSGGIMESRGIVNALENRAAEDGSTLMTQVSDADGYGVYGVGSNAYYTEAGPQADQKRANTRIAIAVALTDSAGVTNGAFYWHGTDFRRPTPRSKAHERFYLSGFKFTKSSHDIWGLGDHASRNRNVPFKYESTAAHGQTTFMRLTEAWMKANGANNWRGTRR